MARVLRTPQANEDLYAIWEYIALHSKTAATKLIRRFDETFQRLAASPGIGERQDQYRQGLRCFPVGRYIIFYLTIQDGIELIRVLHGARDIAALFDTEEETQK